MSMNETFIFSINSITELIPSLISKYHAEEQCPHHHVKLILNPLYLFLVSVQTMVINHYHTHTLFWGNSRCHSGVSSESDLTILINFCFLDFPRNFPRVDSNLQ